MFIRKPKDLTTNKYWFFKHNKLEKEAKPAKYGCKRKYITKKNTLGIEYTKFPKDTNWWNLEKMFGAEHIGESYLTIIRKNGHKIEEDNNGLIIHKDGKWNCCTVLPYMEYRVAKVTAETTPVYDSPYFYNDGHKYDVKVYLELPLESMLHISHEKNSGLIRRFFRAMWGVIIAIIKRVPETIARGWNKGWYDQLREI